MKRILLFAFCYTALSVVGCTTAKSYDSVKMAEMTNNVNIEKGIVNPNIADFFIRITDACLLNMKAGELAAEKGSSAEIRDYGKLMVKDHAVLLPKIKKMAAEMQIVLPAAMSADRNNGFNGLSLKQGKEFDNKFIKLMKTDHEKDIDDFTKATELTDDNVRTFAIHYLPLLQSHLYKINALKDDTN